MDNKKVSWNASQGLIAEISNRRSMANTYFIQGNIRKAFTTLISIKQSVVQSFNDTERTSLDEIEKKFNKISFALSSSFSGSFDSKLNKINHLARQVASKLYSEYNNSLMDLLDDRGYLISEQTDASTMKF